MCVVFVSSIEAYRATERLIQIQVNGPFIVLFLTTVLTGITG